MLNPKKNLRTFDNHAPIYFEADPNFQADLIELIQPKISISKSLYLIENVLSPAECQQLIEKSKPYYQTLADEFLLNERHANRVLSFDERLATTLYDRIETFIQQDDKLVDIEPCGFGTAGTWLPYQVNNCFRYNQYVGPSIGFRPHRDATYIQNEDHRSILTILIYLNDNYHSGQTIFLKSHTKRQKGQTVPDELVGGYHERYVYQPKAGSVLIFNHNLIHLGNEIFESDIKYVIRSDLIFRRVTRPLNYSYSWLQHPDYIQCVKLYREAFNQELDGNIERASKLYERALALRQKHD